MEAIKQMAFALSGNVLIMMPTIAFKTITKLKIISTKLAMNLKDIPEPVEIKRMASSAEEQWGVNTNKWVTGSSNCLLRKY